LTKHFLPILEIPKLVIYKTRDLIDKVKSRFYSELSDDQLGQETKSGDLLIDNRIAWEKSFKISNSIYIYPNPAKDFISINTVGANNMAFRLTDVQGKVCATEKLHSDNETISISDLTKEFYFIEIIDKTDNIVKTSKITKD